MSWQETVHSDTSPPFLTPTNPAIGDTLSIRLRLSVGVPVEAVWVRAVLDGIDHHFRSEQVQVGDRFAWYEARMTLRQQRMNYSFLVRTADRRTWYYNRAGVRSVYPTESKDFTIDTACSAPDWIAGAVFYQIFPDRFYRSGQSPEVGAGEITREPYRSRSMEWSQLPLPYEDGGSLDFFGGDLPGIETRLDYLLRLGVSAIYLNPIFLAKTNHRYDCLDYFAVDPHLGGDDALISLIAAAHTRGIRVILDISINHIGVEHAWAGGMETSGGLVDVVARNPDDSPVLWAGVPELLKLDYTSEELKNRIYRDPDSVLQRYLRPPFEIDGWRFDVASETGRHGAWQGGDELWREIRATIHSVNPQACIIGELWQDASRYMAGDMWDSAMNYVASGRPARMWMGEQDRFAVHPVEEAVPGTPISGHEFGQLLDQHFTRIPSELALCQFNLLDSHDVTRLHNAESVFDWNVYEGLVTLLFMLPGAFSIYYGDEVGLSGTLDGDHGKRHPMKWNETEWDGRFVDLYSRLAHMKRGSRVLRAGSNRVLNTGDEHLVYARFTDKEYLGLVLYRGSEDRDFTVDLSAVGAVTAETVATRVPMALENGKVTVHLAARHSVLIRGMVCDPFAAQERQDG